MTDLQHFRNSHNVLFEISENLGLDGILEDILAKVYLTNFHSPSEW